MRSVRNCIVDVYEHTQHDIHVFIEYVNSTECTLHVHRLDTLTDGWDQLQVYVFSPQYNFFTLIDVEPSTTPQLQKTIYLDIPLEPDTEVVTYPSYVRGHDVEPHYEKITVDEFNQHFQAHLVTLPSSFYAIGITPEKTYIYSEKYILYHEIAPTMRFLIHVIRKYKKNPNLYFVICACDGFPENTHYSIRNKPIPIDPEKYRNQYGLDYACEPNEFEQLHDKRWILCQNNHKDYAFTKPLPDHHYFVLNEYRAFRWIHEGLSFDCKIPKMVFASTKGRSSNANFKQTPLVNGIPNLEITQRELFYQLFSYHENVYAVESGWMQANFVPREEQVYYKYILDMDGLASTWDSFAWKLRSGSVLFRVKGVWNQWFFDHFKEGIHYISIEEDFSDLLEKYEWCEQHPEECKQIIYNACQLFEIYRLYHAEKYVLDEVVCKI